MRHLKFTALILASLVIQPSFADTVEVNELTADTPPALTLINRKTAEQLKLECVDVACSSIRIQGFRDIKDSVTPKSVTLSAPLFAKRIDQCRQVLGRRTIIDETNDAMFGQFSRAYFGNHKDPADVIVLAVLYPIMAVVILGPVIVVVDVALAPEAGVQRLTRPIQYKNASNIVLQIDDETGTREKKVRKNRYKRAERLLRCAADGQIDQYESIAPVRE